MWPARPCVQSHAATLSLRPSALPLCKLVHIILLKNNIPKGQLNRHLCLAFLLSNASHECKAELYFVLRFLVKFTSSLEQKFNFVLDE